MLATTPSGSCEMRSIISPPRSPETRRGRSACAVSSRKKSMRGRTPFNSLRDCAMGLPTSVVSTCARRSASSTTSWRKRAMAAMRSFSRTRAQRGCASRARRYLAATDLASSAASCAATFPVAGFTTARRGTGLCGPDGHDRGRLAGALALVACVEERAQQRPAVEERRVLRVHELGMPLHAHDEAVAFPADRLHEAVRLRQRLHHEPFAEAVHGLVV